MSRSSNRTTTSQDPNAGMYRTARGVWHPRKRVEISEDEWWARAHLFLMDLADAIAGRLEGQ